MAEVKPITVHARESFLIPKKSLPLDVRDELIEKYKFRFYEDKNCKQCEFFEDRHSDACDNCGSFLGGADLASMVKIGEKEFLKTPLGDAGGLKQVLEKSDIPFKFKKHFPTQEFSRPIKFTGTLKDYQPAAVDAILKKKRGVLKAPPRSGKTVMGAAAVCRLGKKTIIMASQREWILGFQETFIGSDTQAALTNCRKTQIGLCKTYEDFLKYDICLVTCQTFWSAKGRKLLRRVRDMFAMLLFLCQVPRERVGTVFGESPRIPDFTVFRELGEQYVHAVAVFGVDFRVAPDRTQLTPLIIAVRALE
jgi:hypothetical protein